MAHNNKKATVRHRDNGDLRQKLKEARDQLAKAEREKRKRAESSARLRYLQTCLMRLGLMLSSYVGEAEDFLDVVATYPFDDGYIITRQQGNIAVKNEASKTLRLEAAVSEKHLFLTLYGGKSYRLHVIEARCGMEYVGTTWRIENLW